MATTCDRGFIPLLVAQIIANITAFFHGYWHMTNLEHAKRLDHFYRQVKGLILDKQHPVTGLLPASTAVTIHGDYRDAWVRDNVYSVLAVWALGLSYRSIDNDGGRSHELEQSTIKLMRGLLRSMMRQADKVERFKSTMALHDALHAKYNTETGSTVVGDHEWGHLQIDATSLYLLMLVQMIASGLDIIWTTDEVNFVQNLVYYIERAYRAPDYGIWERGEKSNIGYVELNASSLAMAKAAMRTLDDFDLYGARGSQASVIHVNPDNLAQTDITLMTMLPRESKTKEIDAALLSAVGFPAFAVDDAYKVDRIYQEIISKLEGNYGLKRFLRDGHQTVLEDPNRHYYHAEELKLFEDIESEWPLFYVYLLLNSLFDQDLKSTEHYHAKIQKVLVQEGEFQLIPELYFVPEQAIEAEKEEPGSQARQPNENVPLIWAQSLYLVAQLLQEGFIDRGDVDPMGLSRKRQRRHPVIQIALLAEDEALQTELGQRGVETESWDSLHNIRLRLPEDIAAIYEQVGRNDKLKLTGRPQRRMKTMTTSRLYRVAGETMACLSLFFMQREFYLAYDMHFLLARFKSELAYLHRHWNQVGRPTVTVLLTRGLMDKAGDEFFDFMQQIRSGEVEGVPVVAKPLKQLIGSASFEQVDNIHDLEFPQASPIADLSMHDRLQGDGPHEALDNVAELEIETEEDLDRLRERLTGSGNFFEQVEILTNIKRQIGLEGQIKLNGTTVSARLLLEEIYQKAGRERLWAVVRQAAALLGKLEVDLQTAVTNILVRHKIIQVGKAYSEASLIRQMIPFDELIDKINTYCRDDIRDRVLTQEVLVYLGLLIKAQPPLFKDLSTIRVSYIILLLTGDLARRLNLSQDEAYERLMHLAPSRIQTGVREALENYQQMGANLNRLEHLQPSTAGRTVTWMPDLNLAELEKPAAGWMAWRQSTGTIGRLSKRFFGQVWEIFSRSKGLIIGDKLDRRNRIDSQIILSEMTPQERAFALRIEHLLNKIDAPEYRQLNMEAIDMIASFMRQNPDLEIEDHLVLDVLLGHAVRLAYIAHQPDLADAYHDNKADAWQFFYELDPSSSSNFMAQALRFLLVPEEQAA